MPRDGSFALALDGKTRKVQDAPFGLAGRSSFALNRILSVSLVMVER
jgi:hypothetical protein